MSKEDKLAFIEARKAKKGKNRSKAKVVMSPSKVEKLEKGEESEDIEDLIFESQNFQEIQEKCKEDGTTWEDDIFPPSKFSLCAEEVWDEKYDEYEWTKVGLIPSLHDDEGELQMYVDDPAPEDVA
jgi:hypothetical protein